MAGQHHPERNKRDRQARQETYGVRSILSALEMDHAVQAREGGAATLAAVGVEFLLREHISTVL